MLAMLKATNEICITSSHKHYDFVIIQLKDGKKDIALRTEVAYDFAVKKRGKK